MAIVATSILCGCGYLLLLWKDAQKDAHCNCILPLTLKMSKKSTDPNEDGSDKDLQPCEDLGKNINNQNNNIAANDAMNGIEKLTYSLSDLLGHCVVVIITAQLHSTKSEFRFWADSNLAHGMLEIRDGEKLWQWSRLEIKVNTFHWSTIPQK